MPGWSHWPHTHRSFLRAGPPLSRWPGPLRLWLSSARAGTSRDRLSQHRVGDASPESTCLSPEAMSGHSPCSRAARGWRQVLIGRKNHTACSQKQNCRDTWTPQMRRFAPGQLSAGTRCCNPELSSAWWSNPVPSETYPFFHFFLLWEEKNLSQKRKKEREVSCSSHSIKNLAALSVSDGGGDSVRKRKQPSTEENSSHSARPSRDHTRKLLQLSTAKQWRICF